MKIKITEISVLIISFLVVYIFFGEREKIELNNSMKSVNDWSIDYRDNDEILCPSGIMHVKYPDIVFSRLSDVFDRKLELFDKNKKLLVCAIGGEYIDKTYMTIDSIVFNPDSDPIYAELTGYNLASRSEYGEYFIVTSGETRTSPKMLPFSYNVDSTNKDAIVYYLLDSDDTITDTLAFITGDKYYQLTLNGDTLLSIINYPFYFNFGIDYLFDYDNDNNTDWIGSLGTINGNYNIFYKSSQPGKVALAYERWCDHKCLHENSLTDF